MSFALLEETRALRSEVADMSMVSRPYLIRIRSDPIQELYELKKIVVAVQASVASIAAARRATGRVTKGKGRKGGRVSPPRATNPYEDEDEDEGEGGVEDPAEGEDPATE